MRVVQLLPELNEGGVERGVVELNRVLVARGIESIVISAGGKQAPRIDTDGGRHINFDVCSKNPFTAVRRVLRLRTLLQELKPDILHARSRVPAWLTFLANNKLKLPFVTTVHGMNSVNKYSQVMTFGDRVVCVSQAIKEYVQQHYNVPDEKIVVIHRGVDLELFNPASVDRDFIAGFLQEHALEERFVVTAVGRITQLKDYETFIRAIALAKQSLPDICGLIVGGVRADKQDYYADLQQRVKTLGVEDQVRFVGSQSRIAEIYTLSDVVVSCSKKPESFGRTAAEALAMNVPVIATRHGGVVEIIEDGFSGILVTPENAEELALAFESVRTLEMRDFRSEVVAKFSLNRMVADYLKVYNSFSERGNEWDR